MTNPTLLTGGEWIIQPSSYENSFTPEDFDEEQKMVLEMCQQFLEKEVVPLSAAIENQTPGVVPSLLEKAGEIGLLGTAIPQKYGGQEQDFITSTIINEGLGAGSSFSVAVAAHTGIGTLPILYFGTEAQKEKYIPKLATGEWKGAYGLTEPNSGSDALSAKTTAVLSADGSHYVLNGQKCWITNGGFADVFIVFAKIDGKEFTAFIVEKDFSGFTHGPEEHKMGIRGSSTVQLYFQDCLVPVENVLGTIGKGHIIAFNILNIGRLKLGAAVIGGAKKSLAKTINYANTREQFNTKIGQFGAIQQKLAQMAIEIWVAESALYRTAKWIDDKEKALLANKTPYNEALLGAAEEYAIECAMIKVFGSEMLNFVVDEGVQIHGGNGFSDEYTISRDYRDSRINRIFEGTNEINRLLAVDRVLKKAMKGELNLYAAAKAVQQELLSIPDFNAEYEGLYGQEMQYIKNFKKTLLLVAGAAVQKLGVQLKTEQEILMHIADIAILSFHAESALLRLMKIKTNNPAKDIKVEEAIVHTFLWETAEKINKIAKEAIMAFAEGDELKILLIGVKRFTKTAPYNTKTARRLIAEKLLSANAYSL